MKEKFQIFGSKSSLDVDCMIFIDEIHEKPHINTNLCEHFNKQVSELLNTDKKVNSNLAIISDGVVIKSFKGTEDEIQNSLIKTYDLHKQLHPLQLTRLVPRDIELKVLRTLRVLLSFVSRTEHRENVKKALKGDAYLKIETLKSIDISGMKFLPHKNVTFEDFIKVYAFQLVQTKALIEGVELYTKEEMIVYAPELERYILRDTTFPMDTLNEYMHMFLKELDNFKFINVNE